MISMIVALSLLTVLYQDPETVSSDPDQQPGYDYLSLDPAGFEDDLAAPEPDPQFTIRPGVPYTRRGNGNGTATARFTGPVVVTVRPPRIAFPIRGYSRTPRTSRIPAGWEFTGPDRNNNNIPDDLESEAVDIRNE